MFSLFFGNYLMEKNRITESEYDSILKYQKTTRVKLGLIAVAEGLLTTKQADEINQRQAVLDKRFGDIAVEKRYLTPSQVEHLLSLQGNPYMLFTQSVVDKNIMSIEEVESELKAYKEDCGITDEEIAALKSGDIDKITSVFVKVPNSLYFDLASLAIRNLNRFISTEIYLEKGYMTKEYKKSHVAIQELDGQHKIFTAFGGDENTLLTIACAYGKEDFDIIDEDSYDAVCEFINVINGLFASKLSEEDIEVDMLPPDFKDNAVLTSKDEFYILPIVVAGSPVDFIMGIDHTINIS